MQFTHAHINETLEKMDMKTFYLENKKYLQLKMLQKAVLADEIVQWIKTQGEAFELIISRLFQSSDSRS